MNDDFVGGCAAALLFLIGIAFFTFWWGWQVWVVFQ
jgi:hypothetical protein